MDSRGRTSLSGTGSTRPLELSRRQITQRVARAPVAWGILVLSFLSFSLAIYFDFAAPSIGAEVARGGQVNFVLPGSAAWTSGIRAGDVVTEVNGNALSVGEPAFARAAPDTPWLLRIAGSRGDRDLIVVPHARWRERLDALTSSHAAAMMRSLAAFVRVGVNALMLGLAALILLNRYNSKVARLAAVTLACWVGGNDIGSIAGVRAVLESYPAAVSLSIYSLDLAFLCCFFSAALHFALVFPVPFRFVRDNRWSESLPWICALPLVTAGVIGIQRAYAGEPPLPAGRMVFELWGVTLLILQLVVLLLHLAATLDVTDRRRIHLVLASTVPGLAAWIVSMVVAAAGGSDTALAFAELLRWMGAAIGGAIFAHAISRQRLFDIRPLLRLGVRYVLARGTLLALISLPALLLAGVIWRRRHDSLVTIVTTELTVLAALLLVLVLVLRYRHALLDRFDRRFFRDSWRAHESLLRVVGVLQHGSDPEIVARVAISEIERSLRPRGIAWYRAAEGSFHLASSGGEFPATLPPEERGQWIRQCQAELVVEIRAEDSLQGLLVLRERDGDQPYTRDERKIIEALATQIALTESYSRMEELARRDALTDAFNRHSFDSVIRERTRSIDHGCVALIDVDGLKAINDTYGHAAGDRAIRRVAMALRTRISSDDVLFRWGGDEFVILFFGKSAEACAPRLTEVSQILRSHTGPPLQVSVGVTDFASADLIPAALEAADRKMYEQKAASRAVSVSVRVPKSGTP